MTTTLEEPILSRINRLDNILRQLEEIRGSNRSPKSSCASTPSSGTLTSDGHASSLDFSPKSLEKHCRPIDRVIMETEVKGTLIERLNHVEDRVLKLCLQLEVELEADRKKYEKKIENKPSVQTHKKKGLKQLVKQCVKGKGKHKTRLN
ncbi:Nucleolar and coiled-body phosphoprotein like [Quillaja saponaria]|uniref:Nucleolar and coiled-body phosphoprotein like n=1 Tax=Quillaja saponaria TaxID=32244 RepID=A0AAD7PBY2_QUISA|nr:Nucleolar and coiled-body phosphoprotein like [Quillaja saponaria]